MNYFFFFFILFLAVVLWVVYEGWHMYRRIQCTQYLKKKSRPFSHIPEKAAFRVLIVGDGGAAGVGSRSPRGSIAGKLYDDYPKAEIVNFSKPGLRIEQVREELKRAQGEFDMVILYAGANDILSFSKLSEVAGEVRKLLRQAKNLSPTVALLTTGNLGVFPFFPWPLSRFYEKRSRKFLHVFKRIALEEEVVFVDLYRDRGHDPFAKEPEKYFAEDGLHLTEEGYAYFYKRLMEELAGASGSSNEKTASSEN